MYNPPAKKIISNRVKVAFIAPCLGVGGADALMQGLVRYAHHLDFTGIAVSGEITLRQVRWFEKALNWCVPIHQAKTTMSFPGINYHDSWGTAVYNAVEKADIIFTWSQSGLVDVLQSIDLPVIEYAQNSDEKAKEICEANSQVTHYKVACSKSAKNICFPDDDKIPIIYNGIDPGRVVPRKGRELQRQVWGIKPEHKVLTFMGRLVGEKHPHALIQALQHLPEEWLGLYVGEGELQPQLFEDAKRFIPGKVSFIRPEYHVGDILAASDCFILPSDYEGHPLALMEAMLAGVPCVYTNFDSMEELHEIFGPMGTMVPKCSTGEIYSTAIMEAVEQSEQSFMKMNNAREVVWHNFTLPTISHQWEELIEFALFDFYRIRRLTMIYPALQEKPYK